MRKTLGLLVGMEMLLPSASEADQVISHLNKAFSIEYKNEKIGEDYWQRADETEELKTGDCEDQAIYLHNLLIKDGYKADIAFGKMFLGSDYLHAWVEMKIDGIEYILDPTGGFMVRRDKIGEKWYVKLSGQRIVKNKLDDFLRRSGTDYDISMYYTDEFYDKVFDSELNNLNPEEEPLNGDAELIINPFTDKEKAKEKEI
jgi:transglutaminase-like putative cysteine protease